MIASIQFHEPGERRDSLRAVQKPRFRDFPLAIALDKLLSMNGYAIVVKSKNEGSTLQSIKMSFSVCLIARLGAQTRTIPTDVTLKEPLTHVQKDSMQVSHSNEPEVHLNAVWASRRSILGILTK